MNNTNEFKEAFKIAHDFFYKESNTRVVNYLIEALEERSKFGSKRSEFYREKIEMHPIFFERLERECEIYCQQNYFKKQVIDGVELLTFRNIPVFIVTPEIDYDKPFDPKEELMLFEIKNFDD